MADLGYIAGVKRARGRLLAARVDVLMVAERLTDPPHGQDLSDLSVALVLLTRRVDDVAALQELYLDNAERIERATAKRERRYGFVVGALTAGLLAAGLVLLLYAQSHI